VSSQQSFMPDEAPKHRAFKRATKKPVGVFYRAHPDRGSAFFKDWMLFGRYVDEETAQQVLRQKSSDPYFEYQIGVPT